MIFLFNYAHIQNYMWVLGFIITILKQKNNKFHAWLALIPLVKFNLNKTESIAFMYNKSWDEALDNIPLRKMMNFTQIGSLI